MNLFAGLEKFGIKADNTTDLFEDEKSRQHPLMVENRGCSDRGQFSVRQGNPLYCL